MKIPATGAVLDYAQRLGWRRALLRGAYVAANQFGTVSILDCVRLRREDIATALAETAGGYECRFLAPGEADRFAGQLDSQSARILPEALARGDAVYVVLDGDRLASIGFYAEGPTPILNDLVIHFDSPARYMYGGYTQAAYRGRRLHALGILRAARELFDHHVPLLVSVCERTNYPAVVSVHRMGWQPCGAVYRVGVGPWMWFGQTAAARTIGMRLSSRHAKIPA